ncbi:MBL fold metallo-hydrolase [Parafilimonas sp.]|uniref:MBL fold metallo-hydrolase n=1 Tax=Parafilimonas sp. TaxID=1969739 RepID=UPI0039E5C401
MSLFIASLNSGSNGNCYYVGNNNEAVLIDAGISCRETAKRMNRLGLSMQKIKAVFISHEHDDHISGLEMLAKKYALPVYITEATLHSCRFKIQPELIHHFGPNERIRVGSLTIKTFSKKHDACDPHSFLVQDDENVCTGIFTDIGKACEQVIYHFKQCHAAFLEANYDEAMLAAGSYPWPLKKRISGGNGHLSNAAALELFNMHRSCKLTHLILSHLSKNNNTPELVEQTFRQHAGETKIVVAGRYRETEVYHIQNKTAAEEKTVYFNQDAVQLTMFN